MQSVDRTNGAGAEEQALDNSPLSYRQIRELLREAADLFDQDPQTNSARISEIQIELSGAIQNPEPSIPEDFDIHECPKKVAVDLLFSNMIECGTLSASADLFDAIINS